MHKLVKGGLFMGKLALVLLVLGLVALPVMAQSIPKVEVFGGFQYDRTGGINLKGWDTALTANVNRWFGVTGDFSGGYTTGFHEYKYLFGPVVSVGKGGPISPFVHVLFGGFRDTGTVVLVPDFVTGMHAPQAHALLGSGSVNGLAIASGGGLDVKVSRHVAIRVAQVDWLMERFAGVWSHDNVRFSSGLLFRF
jgi:hypothetical protein